MRNATSIQSKLDNMCPGIRVVFVCHLQTATTATTATTARQKKNTIHRPSISIFSADESVLLRTITSIRGDEIKREQ